MAYESPPIACERLDAIIVRCGGAMMREDRGGGRLDYPLPPHVSTEIREFFESRASVMLECGFVARLPGGRVFGSGNVLSPDGRTVARDVSEDFGKPFSSHWLLTYPRIHAPRSLPGKTTVAATTLGASYSHWLLEELPRLLSVDLSGCDALIVNARESFAREALGRVGFSGAVLPAKRDQHVQCEQLMVPSLPGPAGYPTAGVVRLVSSFAEAMISGGNPAGLGERLYVSRAKARRRRLINEDLLWPRLESRGFTRLYLEGLTWAEQIGAFHRARVVVAPHGAGLANILFCTAGTRVVEIFGRGYVNPCFWRLAALKRLDYRGVVAPGETPLQQDLRANRDDIEADVSQVLRMLE